MSTSTPERAHIPVPCVLGTLPFGDKADMAKGWAPSCAEFKIDLSCISTRRRRGEGQICLLDVDDWDVSRPGCFNPGEIAAGICRTVVQLSTRADVETVGKGQVSWRCQDTSHYFWAVQLVASDYTIAMEETLGLNCRVWRTWNLCM